MVHNPGLYFYDTLSGALPAATARPSARNFCLLPPPMEIGIEPTARHAADLGIIPVVIEDACGAGHVDAAQRSCQALHFAGAAIMTDTEAFCAALGKASGAQAKQKISDESDSARLDQTLSVSSSCCSDSGRPGSCPPRTD